MTTETMPTELAQFPKPTELAKAETGDNLEYWKKASQPPTFFLKKIGGGKLSGKTDINPQWRLMAMTQMFGMVGKGWDYHVKRTWEVPNPATGELMCFAEVVVRYCLNGVWSNEFSGIGGSMLIEKNKNGIQCNDDGYKMAVTDGLSVAFKAIGIASDVYLGNYNDSKYSYVIDRAFDETPPPPTIHLPTLDNERFEGALNAIANGSFPKERLLKEYALTEEQYYRALHA